MKNRARKDIIYDILNAMQENGPMEITRLLYRSMISYQQLLEYTSLLKEAGLMEMQIMYKRPERKEYRITAKGSRYCQIYREMLTLLDIKIHHSI